MNLGPDFTSDSAGDQTSRHIALDLNADSARVTSLSLEGGRLYVTIEAELADSHIRAADPSEQHLVDSALRGQKAEAHVEKPHPAAGAPARKESGTGIRVAETPAAPSSATGFPAPGLDFSLTDEEEEEDVMGGLNAAVQTGGSEAIRPAAKPAAGKTSDRFSVEGPPKSITLGSLDDIELEEDANSTQSSFAPTPAPASITLEPETAPLRPSQRVITQPKSISIGDDDLTPPLQPKGPTPPAAAPVPPITLGGADEISLDGLLPDVESASLSLEPTDTPTAAVPEPEPGLSLSLETPQVPAPAKQPIPPPPPTAAPSLSLGDAPDWNAAPPAPEQPAAPKTQQPASMAKEITLGGDLGEMELDLDKPFKPQMSGDSPMPIMETWDPSTLSLDTPMMSVADFDAMTEDSSTVGGERHGEPQPAISFGVGDPVPEAPLQKAPPATGPAPLPGLSLAPEPPPAAPKAPTPPPPPSAAPSISLGEDPVPLSLDLSGPSLEPSPAPLSLEPQAQAAPSPLTLEPPLPNPPAEPPAPAAPAPLTLEPLLPPVTDSAPQPLSLEPLTPPPPSPSPAPSISPLSLEPQAPQAEAPKPAPSGLNLAPPPAPLSLEPAPLSLDPRPAPAANNHTALEMQSPPAAPQPVPQPPSATSPGDEKKPEAGGTTVLIRYTCPKCKTQGMQAVDKVGTVVNCSNCGKAMRLVMKK